MQSPTRLWFVMNSGRQIYAVEREVQICDCWWTISFGQEVGMVNTC